MTTKQVLRLVPGVLILGSIPLTLYVSPWWLALTGFVGANMLQSSVTNWCLLEEMLLKAGLPEAEKVRVERAGG